MAAFDVAVIGGGLSGLLCANILSREGLNVCLIEKDRKAGGSLQTFGRKGTIFNTGLNYTESLDEGQILNQYFRYFGIMDKSLYKRLDNNGFEVIHFNDGQHVFAMGQDNFIEHLAGQFPSERVGLQNYTRKISHVCHDIPLYSLRDESPDLFRNQNISTGAADFIRSEIKDRRLANVLAGNNLLYAGHEQKTPLFIHALINHSFIESAWRVVDGSHRVVNLLLQNFKKNGGTVMLGAKAIRLEADRQVIRSVILENGEKIEASNFIAGIHPQLVLDMIEPAMMRKSYATRIKELDDTMGMFTLYLVFRKNSFPYLNYNFYHYNQDNVWVASDYRPHQWPQNYLFMTTAGSASVTHAESASVITYMDFREVAKWEHTFTGDRGDDYLEFKQEKAGQLLAAVERQFPDIRNHIEASYTSTPLTWRDYTGTRAGSAYGILKDCNRPIESIILPRTKFSNLFLTGQNTNVHGILGVTISSVVTCANLIGLSALVSKIRNA